MKIAYVIRWDLSTETGVVKKIRDQIQAWLGLGHEVRLFALAPRAEVWEGLASLDVHVVTSADLWSRGRRARELTGAVRSWGADLVYLRFTTYYSPFAKLMRRVPTVLELNTDDVREYRLYLPRHKYLYHLATRGWILKRARGMVCVTNEIADRYRGYGKPIAVIANGADLASFPILPPAGNRGVRAVFIGSPDAPWHGVDKVLDLAGRLVDWRFELIGPTVAAAPSNVSCHGYLSRSNYESILASADLAIGTLALHRNEMDEACPLKVREYLALGLPCIVGHRDTDFPWTTPFLLELPNTPDNVIACLQEIRDFGDKVKGVRVPRESVAHLDVAAKESRRVRFFAEVLGQGAESTRAEVSAMGHSAAMA